jgi:hypothetical protein
MQIKTDTCLTAINIKDKAIIQSFGTSGHGPNDVNMPTFISSIDHSDILLQDGIANRFNKIEFNPSLNQYTVSKYMTYSHKIFRSGETNISQNFISGRTVIDVDYYPPIKNLNKRLDFNYIYAPSIALNEGKNRIIIGMFHFDIFQIYDLSGNRLKTCYLSDKCIPEFYKSEDQETVMQKCEMGFIRSFSTKDYCYFLRIARDFPNNKTKLHMLIQTDWEGELINAYYIPDEVLGHFFIDEQNKKMYIIRHSIVQESAVNEIFELVSYQLQ